MNKAQKKKRIMYLWYKLRQHVRTGRFHLNFQVDNQNEKDKFGLDDTIDGKQVKYNLSDSVELEE